VDLVHAKQFTVQSASRDYCVIFEENESPFLFISELLRNKKNLLLIDAKLYHIYKSNFNFESNVIFIAEASEHFKSLEGVTKLLDFLQKNEVTKSEQLIVVGGGIIQEIAAFTCALYKRGISWVQFPTTLLSMCDSCIGGKAGINYGGAKNQLGLFSTPQSIYINQQFLKTLSNEEVNSGLGEILKYCIIGGNYFIELYREHVLSGKIKYFASFKSLIAAALSIKKTIVEIDEFESNYRRACNYGHTIGHAIEALSNYQIPHGQAVVLGIILVNEISHIQNLLSKKDLDALNKLCFDLVSQDTLSCLKKISLDGVIGLIQKDKKTMGKYTNFVLLKSPGDICIAKLELNEKLYVDIQNAFKKLLMTK
jgi:3-dehydroquinate synthase